MKNSIIFLGEKNVLIITKRHVKFLHGQRLHSKCRVRCAGARRSPFPCGITEVPSSPLYFLHPPPRLCEFFQITFFSESMSPFKLSRWECYFKSTLSFQKLLERTLINAYIDRLRIAIIQLEYGSEKKKKGTLILYVRGTIFLRCRECHNETCPHVPSKICRQCIDHHRSPL